MKLIVIGLDGASFELLDPWIAEGRLPNIARIKEEGAWGHMASVLPPVTSPNWKCYSTGKNPGKLGVFWWENIDWANRKVYFAAQRTVRAREIWDYMSEAGMRVGVVGMPTTYPPKKVNGFLISGGETPDSNFAYPREIEARARKLGWRTHPLSLFHTDVEQWSQEVYEIIDANFRTARALGDEYEPDFLQATTFYINSLHHYLWDAPHTRRAWELIDRHIGDLLQYGCDVLIMSDHGSNRITNVLNINSWLQHEGYLQLRPNLASVLYRLGLTRGRLLAIISKLHLLRLAWRVVPRRLYREVPRETGEVRREAKTNKVDWRKSRAQASGQGPVYLNPVDPDRARLREELKQKLENLVDPGDGRKPVERVYMREELYHGEFLSEAPDLVIDQAKGVHIPGGIGQTEVFSEPHRWRAENKKYGLFMAYGPNVKATGELKGISILDLAPTILHMLGIEVPRDMDGRVLSEIFAGPPSSREQQVPRVKSETQRVRQWIHEARSAGDV